MPPLLPSLVIEATGVLVAGDLELLDMQLPEAGDTEQWIGVGCSWKRLLSPAQGGASAPSLDTLPELLNTQPKRAKICLHYTPKDSCSADLEFIELIRSVPEIKNIHAVQLNGAVSDSLILERIRKELPNSKLIIQIPIYRMTDGFVSDWFSRCGAVKALANGVLIDGSGGKGEKSNRERMYYWRDIAAGQFAGSIVGLAGGFSASELQRLALSANDCITLLDCTSSIRLEDRFCVEKALGWFESGSKIRLSSEKQKEA